MERAVAEALTAVRELRAMGALPPALEALTLIAPPRGFSVLPELRPFTDHARPDAWGRDGWDPRNGTVNLVYEPGEEPRNHRGPERREWPDSSGRGAATGWGARPGGAPAERPPTTEEAQRDLIGVVARAEGDPSFKFLALKFLRDQLLPRAVAWAHLPSEAQIQINRAVDVGLLVTGKVDNPRTPQYPVTTVALNRENGLVQEVLAELARADGAAADATTASESPAADPDATTDVVPDEDDEPS
jgi:hypothetical protein